MTRGNPLGFTALLSRLNPRNGIITGVVRPGSGELPALGQVKCVEGRRNAHLTFLLPGNVHESPALPHLMDGLARQAGLWGAFGLLAEVEELAPIFENLRQAGFSVYGWQRIYQVPFEHSPGGEAPLWRFAGPADELPIRQLNASLVPPLVQAADPLPAGRLYGLVHEANGHILAYIESVFGPEGIYLRPLVHPNVANVGALLQGLEGLLSPLLGRRVYMAVRSYQSWLEHPLTSLSSDATVRQALMVKYVAALQRATLGNLQRARIEDASVNPSVPPMVKNAQIDENRVK